MNPNPCEPRCLWSPEAATDRQSAMTDKSEIKTLAAAGSWGRGRVYDSIAETIGHTPQVRLSKVMAASHS